MKGYLFHIIFLFLCSSVLGQLATSPNFHADIPIGCAPLTVTMVNDYVPPAGESLSGYRYKFPGMADYDNTGSLISFKFTEPGTYTIWQLLYLTKGNIESSIQIKVLDSPKPEFQYYICEGNRVDIKITNKVYDQYSVDFGDGTTVSINDINPHSHFYTDPTFSSKTITVKGEYNPTLCGGQTSVTVKPLNSLIPAVIQNLFVNDQSTNGQITLDFSLDPTQRYYLQQNIIDKTGAATGYKNVDTFYYESGFPKYTIKKLNTQDNQYCYKLIAFDDCGKILPSNEVCSIISSVKADNNKNIISWQSASAVGSYSIIKNSSPPPIVTAATSPFNDINVICGEKSCYFVTWNNVSYSDTFCVTAISKNIPPAVQNFNSTYTNQNIELSWDKPTAGVKLYQLQRIEDGVSTDPYATFTSHNFVDNKIEENTEYCYQIDYIDNCINTSPKANKNTCPVLLNLITNPNNIFENDLTWTSYSGATTVQGYVLEKLDENNNVLASFPSSSFKYTDLITNQSIQLLKYRIKLLDNSGNGFSYSNIVEIRYEGSIFLPNAFSPNGDGKNDIFIGKSKFIKDYKLTVFNRWGEVIFSTTNLNEGWDGNYNGNPVVPDTYAYLLNATDLWSKKITKRGTITVLR